MTRAPAEQPIVSIHARRYISEKEAADRYPYSRYWFQRMRCYGGGPPYLKIRNRIMYPIPEIDTWFDAHGLRVDGSLPSHQLEKRLLQKP